MNEIFRRPHADLVFCHHDGIYGVFSSMTMKSSGIPLIAGFFKNNTGLSQCQRIECDVAGMKNLDTLRQEDLDSIGAAWCKGLSRAVNVNGSAVSPTEGQRRADVLSGVPGFLKDIAHNIKADSARNLVAGDVAAAFADTIAYVALNPNYDKGQSAAEKVCGAHLAGLDFAGDLSVETRFDPAAGESPYAVIRRVSEWRAPEGGAPKLKVVDVQHMYLDADGKGGHVIRVEVQPTHSFTDDDEIQKSLYPSGATHAAVLFERIKYLIARLFRRDGIEFRETASDGVESGRPATPGGDARHYHYVVQKRSRTRNVNRGAGIDSHFINGERTLATPKPLTPLRFNERAMGLQHGGETAQRRGFQTLANSIVALPPERRNDAAASLVKAAATLKPNVRKDLGAIIGGLQQRDSDCVLDKESRRLLAQCQTQPDLLKKIGEMAAPTRVERNIDGRPVQTDEEWEIREFFAELIFPRALQDADGDQPVRIRQMLMDHQKVLLKINNAPDAVVRAGLPKEFMTMLDGMFKMPPDEETVGFLIAFQPHEDLKALWDRIEGALATFSFHSVVPTTMLESLVAKNECGGNLGKFLTVVFRDYFDEQIDIDKRAMIASFLRDARANDSDEMKLLGLLKGAGPYMQKVLQLFGDTAEGPLKVALGELKTGLHPIPCDLKRSIFAEIVQRSEGKITRIDGFRSLGAASVGEAVAARIHLAGETLAQDVVAKLMRPGILERAERERRLFEAAAKHIDGMAGTFKGIADQIDTEMDLSREAANVVLAQVYNKGATIVQAMRLVDIVAPRSKYMLVEEAPGDTVKETLTLLGERLAQNVPDPVLMDAGLKLASALATVAEKWFEESLFGSGFYHGDLHSGNMMFSSAAQETKGLTVIDMGNAAVLSNDQKGFIFKMISAVNANAPDVFVRSFESVLSPDGKALMAKGNNRRLFQQVAGGILAGRSLMDALVAIDNMQVEMGTLQAGKQRDAQSRPEAHKELTQGLKIGYLLEAANVLGMEIPATVANFSRSQLLLEKSINDVNVLIDAMGRKARRLLNPTVSKLQQLSDSLKPNLSVGQAKKFEAALSASPPDYRILRGVAEDVLSSHPAPASLWTTFRFWCNLGVKHKISFPDIVATVVKRHPLDSTRLIRGGLFELGTKKIRSRLGDSQSLRA